MPQPSPSKQKKKEEEDRSMRTNVIESARPARKAGVHPSTRYFAFAMSLYPVWTDVDAIYQVLKQAGEIRGNSTNSPPTPPTAEHPPSGAAPSSTRTSSHPCSSSTSGKTRYRYSCYDLGTCVSESPRDSSNTVADSHSGPR